MRKYLFSFSILLNISLLAVIFQFKDKIQAELFPAEEVNILLIGDSLLAQENWNILLGRDDVKNEAFGGAITQQILWNIERGQLNSKPKLVILNGGINDLLSGVPVQRVFENYMKIIETLKAHNIKIIPCCVVNIEDNEEINSKVTALNILLKDYFQQQEIAFIDLNLLLENNHNFYQADGIHLNKNAYQIWAKELIGFLK